MGPYPWAGKLMPAGLDARSPAPAETLGTSVRNGGFWICTGWAFFPESERIPQLSVHFAIRVTKEEKVIRMRNRKQ